MDKQRAKLMLEETFKNRFDNENFIQFIKELFNKFEDCKKECGGDEIPKEFQEFIDSYSLFGRYEDSEGKSIDVLAVKLKKNNPESARTTQRNFIAKHLAQRNVNSALVAFYGEEIDNWRFSFVKLEYHLEKDEKGNIKPATSLTPPKRCSFLVGKTEPSHTAQSRFLELLIKEDSNPMISEIDSAFNVEKVTKEFFEEYKGLFLELEESLNKIVKRDKELDKEFTEKGISTTDFTKKLLGQIVFLYFLQKKGWLGIEKDENGKFKEWGTGHKDFLKKLYNKEIVDYNNFFNDILEPLFYDALAKEHDEDYSPLFKCKIPFLNGGLFEPLGGYNWTNTNILLDNKIFGKIIETFDLYNFTVKEDEPLEKEVAIDPEMLGKVFENLLEIKDRKSKGSYYTPREIVHYMCQESLINYLETETGIDKKHIETFIHNGEVSNQIRDNHERIDKLLKDIKVVDPAIGSGAFPVGMMMEIIKARSSLTEFFPKKEHSERTAYNFKRECIEDSLYGVDIDPGAVDIAQLRLWLSLIVDETDKDKVNPLPNLDYKIMCGNSLLEEFEGVKLFDDRLLGEVKKDNSLELKKIQDEIKNLNREFGEIQTGKRKDNGRGKEIKKEIKKLEKKKQELISGPKKEVNHGSLFGDAKKIKESQKKLKELKELHKEFFNENNRKKKNELRKEIEKLDWEFMGEAIKEKGDKEALKRLEDLKKTRSKPFFLWKLYFAEVFQEKGGFDICLANPPYLEFDMIRRKDENFVTYRDGFGMKYKFNLYSLFLKKGPLLLREQGALSYIVPNSFSKEKYNQDIREDYLKNKKVISFVDFTQEKQPIFESGSNDSYIVFLVEKTKSLNDFIRIDRYQNKVFIFSHTINQKDLVESFEYQFNISENNKLIKKIEGESMKLGKICLIRVGLTPSKSYKKRYGKDYENFAKKYSGNKQLFKFLRRNKEKDICDEYRIKHHTDYIIWDRESLYKDKVCPGEFEDYFSQKLVFRNRGVVLYGSFDDNHIFVNDIFNVVVLKSSYKNDRYKDFLKEDIELSSKFNLKYLLAVINSNLLNFYLNNKFVFRDVKGPMLENFPIKEISSEQQKLFIELVDKILDITKDGDYLENPKKQTEVKEYETEIDQLVYKLYGLTKEEIEIVENFNNLG